MTQEERNLLVKDLCTRLPYGVIAKKEYTFVFTNGTLSKSKEIEKIDLEDVEYLINGDDCVDVLKPYLRPMSSMTEEEEIEFQDINLFELPYTVEGLDWLNAHHFDYRGLIIDGLAIEAPEGMYNN